MGHGASSMRSAAFHPLFCTHELLEGNKCMMNDECSQAFIRFLKDGGWKVLFSNYFHEEEFVSITLELLARGKFCVSYSYLLPRCRMEEIQTMIEAGSLKLSENSEDNMSSRILPFNRVSGYFRGVIGGNTSGQSARGVKCFTSRENAAILFSALYTMFSASAEKENGAELHSLSDSVAEESYGIHCDESTPAAPRISAHRSAVLLSDFANSIPEADLLKELQVSTWAVNSWRPFEESSLCITIVDTLAPGCHFVYANTSFLRFMGYTANQALYAPVGILTGLHTESLLWDVVVEAISQSKSARVGITLYNRRRQAVFCLVSVKSAGRYAALNYLPTGSPLHANELQVVDDVLCLLTCVVKNVPMETGASYSMPLPMEQVLPPQQSLTSVDGDK